MIIEMLVDEIQITPKNKNPVYATFPPDASGAIEQALIPPIKTARKYIYPLI